MPALDTTFKAIGGSVIAISACTLAVPFILPAVGFTTAGVATSSLATAGQSAIYGAFTTGVFSALQSAGATAAAPAVLPALGGLVGGAGIFAAGRFFR